MPFFGINPKFFICLFLSIVYVISCETNKDREFRREIESIGSSPLSFTKEPLSPYLQNRISRIFQDAELNKLSEFQADEAFLIGKTLEDRKDFENAEKLYRISFNFTQNITIGLSFVYAMVNIKKLDEARSVAIKLAVLYPNRPEPELVLANIYQLQGNQVALLKTLEKAYQKHPNDESIVIFYASTISKNSKKVLENFLLKNPRSTNVMMALSQKYYQEKNSKFALKYAKKAFHLDPDNLEIMTMIAKIEQSEKNYQEAEKFFRMAFEKEIDNNLYAQNYINILIFQKKMPEALSVLLKLEASSDEQVPFPLEFTFQIARILVIEKDYVAAEKRLKELLKSNYDPAIIKYYLAVCNESFHKFDIAIEYLNGIESDSELYKEARKAKIILLINSNKKEEAENQINNFVILEKDIIEDSIFKANILAYFANYNEAIVILNKALQLEPKAKELYLKKAEYLKYAQSEEASLQLAEQITSKWPNYGDGLNFLGYSLIEKNIKLEYAKKILIKAVAIDPQNGFYLDSLGWLYLQKNDLKNAIKYLGDAVKHEPDEPVIIYHLAIAQFKAQQFEKCLKNLEIASKILSSMLPYQLESDPELERITKSIGPKILEVKKVIEMNE